MAIRKGFGGVGSVLRLPGHQNIPPKRWSIAKALGFFGYMIPLVRINTEKGNYLAAIEAMVESEYQLESLGNAGVDRRQIYQAAEELRLPFSFVEYEGIKNDLWNALATKMIGQWHPDEEAYPRYTWLRDSIQDTPTPSRGSQQVNLSGHSNDGRLVIGTMLQRIPGNRMQIRHAPALRPRPHYEIGHKKDSFAHRWGDRKVIGNVPLRRRELGKGMYVL